jgi:DNA-binding GntR family transcriptional regulator
MIIKRESMREQVKRVLLSRILDGTYRPGFRLVELRIARELKTSQGPVREALRELEALRLVKSETYHGSRVREITAREIREACEIRGVLEELSAPGAVAKFKNNAEPLRSELEGLRRAAGSDDRDAYARHNVAFHRVIVEASGNSTLLRLWETLAIEIFPRISLTRAPRDLRKLADSHNAIFEAIVQGNAKTAGRLLRRHADDVLVPDLAARVDSAVGALTI